MRTTPEEIIAEAKSKGSSIYFSDISHLTEDEFILIATSLDPSYLKKWYNEHKNRGFSFPLKSYVVIKAKIDGYVYFNEEEYEARVAAGKRVRYVTPDQLFLERFEDIFYDHSNGFKKKMALVDELIGKRTKIYRLNRLLSLFDIVYEKVRTGNINEDERKSLKAIKSKQTRLNSALELREEDIDFRTLDGYLRRF